MRTQIKTDKPVKDKNVKALYLVDHALAPLTQTMKFATLQWLADKFGYRLVKKCQP